MHSELKKLLQKKGRLGKKAKFSGDQAKWANYKQIKNFVKDNANKAYFSYVKDLTASLNTNPKRFWSFVKSCTKKQSTPGCIIYDGTHALIPEDKANVVLINYFVWYLIKGLIICLPYQDMDVIIQLFFLYISLMI